MFPDAPGCTAMSPTAEAAIADAADALSEWMADWLADGNTVPVPRTYAQIAESGEFPRLGQGALVATIPLLLETGRLARANISLDAGLLASIDAEAARRGVTRSAFLAAAARQTIKTGP
jgi:predicted RNase H-like HicB family nuclease